ncbi:hypothetical protein Tco_0129107 [Tanacetum coccineum]
MVARVVTSMVMVVMIIVVAHKDDGCSDDDDIDDSIATSVTATGGCYSGDVGDEYLMCCKDKNLVDDVSTDCLLITRIEDCGKFDDLQFMLRKVYGQGDGLWAYDAKRMPKINTVIHFQRYHLLQTNDVDGLTEFAALVGV